MQHAIGFIIALRPGADPEQFETSFKQTVEDARTTTGFENAQIQLSRLTDGPGEYLWLTRFPATDFDRVSRGAWPFVILEIRTILTQIRGRFASDITSFSAPLKSAPELMDDWNVHFGRFMKLSLDAPAEGVDK